MRKILEHLARALLARLGEPSPRRRRQREAVLASPFPPAWSATLETRCEHYRRLPTEYRDQFKDQTQVFLDEKPITAVEMEITDEARLLVAASAISLTVGWPDYTWDQLTEVLLYPEDFDRDFNLGGTDASGIAHPWGVVILSVPALNRSFDKSSDGFHVGFHEFAHLLDLAQSRFDGIPSFLSDDAIRQWLTIVQREEDRLRQGDSILDPYALSGSAEFFATAIEAFFQIPTAVADRHGELYAFLSTYLCQEPASWSARATP